jgi:hypothetical protein
MQMRPVIRLVATLLVEEGRSAQDVARDFLDEESLPGGGQPHLASAPALARLPHAVG